MAVGYLVHGVILGLRQISHEPQYCYPKRKTSLKTLNYLKHIYCLLRYFSQYYHQKMSINGYSINHILKIKVSFES
jgi:hypothetical protein